MNLYNIFYRDLNGSMLETVLGEPMSSFDLSGFNSIELIESLFHLIHPGCVIISIKPFHA